MAEKDKTERERRREGGIERKMREMHTKMREKLLNAGKRIVKERKEERERERERESE
jgi:hypothetical protein